MWPLLDPLSLEVVLKDDWAQHVLGWLFFRNERVTFPLGSLPDFLYPLGTTLGYMDAIPWLALALRPISALLPVDFQYLGIWICLSAALLGYFAARVAELSTPHWEQQALAGAFTAMAPTLMERVLHPALCSHMYIVLAIGLHLTPAHTARAAQRKLLAAFLLTLFASATHPYIAMMVLSLLVALPWHFFRVYGFYVSLALSAALIALTGGVLAAFGYFSSGFQSGAGGFGEFSSNLNTFVNSLGHSRIFRGMPYFWGQYEGSFYLGAGGFLLVALVSVLALLKRTRARIASFPWRRALWPLTAALGCAVLALASPLRWGESEVLTLSFYRHLDALTGPFRSSGRFIWPLGYLMYLALLTALLRALRWQRWAATGVLLAIVGLQLYDIDTADASARVRPAHRHQLTSPAWSLAERDFKHLVMYPPEILGECDGPKGYRYDEVNALAYLAYRHGWTFNSGYAARFRRFTKEYCEQLGRDVETGDLRADTLYIVWRKDFRVMRKHGAVCHRIDRVNVCVLQQDNPFALHVAAAAQTPP
jgi:hypothetical protein